MSVNECKESVNEMCPDLTGIAIIYRIYTFTLTLQFATGFLNNFLKSV